MTKGERDNLREYISGIAFWPSHGKAIETKDIVDLLDSYQRLEDKLKAIEVTNHLTGLYERDLSTCSKEQLIEIILNMRQNCQALEGSDDAKE